VYIVSLVSMLALARKNVLFCNFFVIPKSWDWDVAESHPTRRLWIGKTTGIPGFRIAKTNAYPARDQAWQRSTHQWSSSASDKAV